MIQLNTKTAASLLISVGLAFSFSANAEIYQWTDEDGKVHYSDINPNEKGLDSTKKTVEKVEVRSNQNFVSNEYTPQRINERLEARRID